MKLCQSVPEINWWEGQPSEQCGKTKKKKTPYLLTSEMPHLRILPRSRLCQKLTRRNALQLLGYVPAERILASTTARRCR